MEELKYRLMGVNFLNKTAYKSEYDISLNYYTTKRQKRIGKKKDDVVQQTKGGSKEPRLR